jgi:LacI family transcriptional regulator
LYTIRDVARLADLSVATVSAVINGKQTVSPESTLRVRKAMEALDYHPDQVARSLKVRRTATVGMVIPDISNPFFTEVMSGVENEARRGGYSVIFCNVNEDPELERHHLSTLFSRRVDGVLLAPTDPQASQDRLTRRRVPLVFFDRVPYGFHGAGVVTDNFGGSLEAGRHLVALGHRSIAIIAGRLDMSNGLARLEGFRQALQEAHLLLPERYSMVGDFLLESGYRCGLSLMQQPHPPTAVFCSNNKMTLGLMRALAELRIPCPDRVSVLGFDDFDWAANFSPRLTTIAQPTFEMGRQAMQILLRKMNPPSDGTESNEEYIVTLKTELHVRDSTAPPHSS